MVRFFEFAVIPLAVIMFYYGKAQEPLLPAPRNWWTDVVIPALGMVVTILMIGWVSLPSMEPSTGMLSAG